jgi:hypothetical protein
MKKWNKTKLDHEQLRIEIRTMSRYSKLFKLLREELTKLDHWKQQGRGDPIKAFHSRRTYKND